VISYQLSVISYQESKRQARVQTSGRSPNFSLAIVQTLVWTALVQAVVQTLVKTLKILGLFGLSFLGAIKHFEGFQIK